MFNCLHWSLALGAIFSLPVITAAQSRFTQTKAFLIANLLSVTAAVITFVLLYLFGATEVTGSRFAVISSLAAARVGAVILVSMIAFIILAGYPKDRSNFASAFFMAHKAFLIALIYGAVIMAGTSGVARAIQSLLYPGMSGNVYAYIGTVVCFLAFTIFIGYFPDFRKGELDEHRQTAQRQPRFIEILFGFILIPIMLALTAVLLIWAGKTVLSGTQVPFIRLSIIAAAYTIGGLWLHVMVSEHNSRLAKVYRTVYPAASLVLLVFEAWALINQLNHSGLKETEYFFILIWLIAAAGAVLLLILGAKAHQIIAVLTCVLAVLAVFPAIGYQALPVTMQVNRLEALLADQGMLDGNQLIPASSKPELAVREAITDAVVYLANADNATLPVWFDKDLEQGNIFKARLGFEQVFGTSGTDNSPVNYLGTYLSLPAEAIDISGYRWVVNPEESMKDQGYITVEASRGTYEITWAVNSETGIPSLQILLDSRVIIDQTMSNYMDVISAKYPPTQAGTYAATQNDMMLRLQSPEVDVLLVFSRVEISVDSSNDVINYWISLNALYMNENS